MSDGPCLKPPGREGECRTSIDKQGRCGTDKALVPSTAVDVGPHDLLDVIIGQSVSQKLRGAILLLAAPDDDQSTVGTS